jgi:hypothetical protein
MVLQSQTCVPPSVRISSMGILVLPSLHALRHFGGVRQEVQPRLIVVQPVPLGYRRQGKCGQPALLLR